jgi:hypothetical protein
MADLAPSREEPVAVWWLRVRKVVAKPSRKGFDTLVLLVAWSLWKERNSRVHEQAALQPVALVGDILEDARLWARAGFVSIYSRPVELSSPGCGTLACRLFSMFCISSDPGP